MLVNMLSATEPSLAGLSVSAREVVLALKKRGEARASEIAEALGITPSGVRQHLSALRADGLVAYRTIHAGPGRPKFAYFLTEPAEALFPKTYHELTNEFLEHLEEEDPELLVVSGSSSAADSDAWRRRASAWLTRPSTRRLPCWRGSWTRLATSPTSRVGPTAPTSSESTTARSWGSRSVMASPAAPSSSSCGRLPRTPRQPASPTGSRAPTCAPTKYDLGGDDPGKFQPQDGRPEGPPAPVSPRIGVGPATEPFRACL